MQSLAVQLFIHNTFKHKFSFTSGVRLLLSETWAKVKIMKVYLLSVCVFLQVQVYTGSVVQPDGISDTARRVL